VRWQITNGPVAAMMITRGTRHRIVGQIEFAPPVPVDDNVRPMTNEIASTSFEHSHDLFTASSVPLDGLLVAVNSVFSPNPTTLDRIDLVYTVLHDATGL